MLPSLRCTGLPLFHMWLWKIPQPLTPLTKHRAPSELYSVCVIRQKTGNIPTRANLLWHSAKVTHETHGPLVYFLWTICPSLYSIFFFKVWTSKAEDTEYATTLLDRNTSPLQLFFFVLFIVNVVGLICIKTACFTWRSILSSGWVNQRAGWDIWAEGVSAI